MSESTNRRWFWWLAAAVVVLAFGLLASSLRLGHPGAGQAAPEEAEQGAAVQAGAPPDSSTAADPAYIGTPADSSSEGTLPTADREARARAARSREPLAAITSRIQDQVSPCEHLHGEWRFDAGGLLVLSPAGVATWQEIPAQQVLPVRWLCMQDGGGEVLLPDGRWRLRGDPGSGSLAALDARGANHVARRAVP